MSRCICGNARRIATLIFLFAATVSVHSVQALAQTDAAADAGLERARAAYLKKDFESATRELKSVQALRKDLAEPYFLIGMIAWNNGKIGDAIKSIKEAIKSQPNYPEAHYVLGKLYFEKQEWKEAETAANFAINQGAKFANLSILLGDALLMQGKYKEAVNAYEQAITQPPPKGDVTEEFRARLVAVKNLIDILSHKGDPNYKLPQFDRSNGVPRAPFGVNGSVKMAGILDEKGEYRPFAVISVDTAVGKNLPLVQTALEAKFSPAMINNAPVPFWLVTVYEKGVR